MTTKRQLELLNLIVEIYVKKGEPISSGLLLELNPYLNLSSATIRNEMTELEKEGYIYKSNASSSRTSGRIPTKKGYEYYLKHIKTNPDSILSIRKKIDKILKNRKDNIDSILSDSMKLINELTNTLTITKDDNSNSKLQDINCYLIEQNKAIVIIVFNNGEVVNKEINLKERKYDDFEKSIKIFSKRLKGINILEIKDNISSLGEILTIELQGMEDSFQEIIKLMFSKLSTYNSKYFGMNSLIASESLDVKKQIKKIFEIIENNSIWDLLDTSNSIETDTSGITVDMDIIDGVSIIKKTFNVGSKDRELTILGSKNQDYKKIFTILEYLESKIKGK